MFDMHYDLLTILYIFQNDKNYINKQIKIINKNLTGICANMYFMSKKEMKKELGINRINTKKMFEKSIEILNKLNIKPKILLSIEGCDYLKVKDLNYLKQCKEHLFFFFFNEPFKKISYNFPSL